MIDKSECERLRRDIKTIADEIGAIRSLENLPGEVGANVTIAYHHLEDASMRLGKAIQALDGGVSVYDKTQVPVSGR